MVLEPIGVLLLFPRSDLQNTNLSTSESYEHTFGKYRKVERYFTVESFMQLEDMNRQKIVQYTKVT